MLDFINQGNYYFQVTNSAFLVIRFSVIYEGKKQQTDNILIGGSRRIYFPEGTVRVTIVIEALFPLGWGTLLKGDFFTTENYCYTVYGTFFLPIVTKTPCSTSSNICKMNELQIHNENLNNYMYKNYLNSINQYLI